MRKQIAIITALVAAFFCLSGQANADGARTATITIHNKNWNSVKIEARIGNQGDVNRMQNLGTKTLGKKGNWKIQSSGEDIRYRRPKNPDDPKSPWGAWIWIVVTPDSEDKTEDV